MGRTQDFVEKRIVRPALTRQLKAATREFDKVIQSKTKELAPKGKNIDLQQGYGSVLFASQSLLDADATDLLGRYFGWVYACVKAIADFVSNAEIKLMRVDGSDVTEVDSHPVLDLVNKFNPDMTLGDGIKSMITHKALTGDAYWLLYRIGTQIDQIRPIRPDWVTINQGDYRKGEFIKSYTVRIPGKGPQEVDAANMLHFKNFHPQNELYGLGVVEAALKTVNLEYLSEEWNNLFFKNAASTGAVIQFPNELNDVTLDRIRNAINQQYTGVGKAHKTMVLDNGATYTEAGRTARDMEFIRMQEWTRDKILAIFHVSKPILGITEDVNRANAEASEYGFIRRVVKPEIEAFVDVLNEMLLPKISGTENLFFDFVDPTPPDQQAVIARATALRGVLTINELRSEAHYDDIGPEGDFIYIPNSEVPLEMPQPNDPNAQQVDANSQPVKGFLKVPGKKFVPKILSSYGKKKLSRVKASSRYRGYMIMKENLEKVTTQVIKALKDDKTLTSEKSMSLFWKDMVDDTKNYIDMTRAAMRKFIDDEGARVVADYLKNNKGKAKSIRAKGLEDIIANPSKMFVIKRTIMDILGRANKNQGKRAFNFIDSQKPTGIPDESYQYSAAVQSEISKSISDFLQSGANYREEVVRKTLTEAVDSGLTVDQTADLLRTKYDKMSLNESRRIARTEVIRSSNLANLEAWKQSGVVVAKQWFTAADERVDQELCAPMHGVIIPLEDNFFDKGDTAQITTDSGETKSYSFDYSDVPTPPLHPNCRCTVAPIVSGLSPEQLNFPFTERAKFSKAEDQFLSDNNVTIQKNKKRTQGVIGSYENKTKTIAVNNNEPHTLFHELGHAIDHNLPSAVSREDVSKALAADIRNVKIHRITKDNDLSEQEALDLLDSFESTGGTSKYIKRISTDREVFADGYAQFRTNPKQFKIYAPKLYAIFKELF